MTAAAAAALAATVLVGATAALGEGGVATSRLEQQSVTSTSQPQTIATASWTPVAGIGKPALFCPRGAAAAAASLDLAAGSAPVDVRIAMDDLSAECVGDDCPADPRMRPGAVTMAASGSFTFVTRRVPGIHGSQLRLEWRSPTAAPATLDKATMHVTWRPARQCL